MEQMQTQELISAMADGQLRGGAFTRGVELAASDPAALEAWQTYHLIGDVLRSQELAAGSLPGVFLSRLRPRLQQEQRLAAMPSPGKQAVARAEMPQQAASNDANFRWKVVAAFASMAAVTAIGWSVVAGIGAKPEQAQLAAVPAATVPVAAAPGANVPGAMIRDPRLDEFLAAHRQLAGASALQAPAGFLRNAAFEGNSR
jgi:sigma-E factor negative regulatory protein RseA